VFVAEGDEERMDLGLRKFVKDHPEFFKNVDALIGEGGDPGARAAAPASAEDRKAASTSS